MGAYMYPITINRHKQRISFDVVTHLDGDVLSLADIAFVGDELFSVTKVDYVDGGGYDICITRERPETDEEHAARVHREECYMAEYRARHPKLEETT